MMKGFIQASSKNPVTRLLTTLPEGISRVLASICPLNKKTMIM